jgi:hypothetical protein
MTNGLNCGGEALGIATLHALASIAPPTIAACSPTETGSVIVRALEEWPTLDSTTVVSNMAGSPFPVRHL